MGGHKYISVIDLKNQCIDNKGNLTTLQALNKFKEEKLEEEN